MAKRMLIDATHPEETRVVVLNGNRIDEFDVESSTKRQVKGNIYLAKVTRVEPSLQAAFVEYGGNRHGFLAFSEIHSDYYRIPVGDRRGSDGGPAPHDVAGAAVAATDTADEGSEDRGVPLEEALPEPVTLAGAASEIEHEDTEPAAAPESDSTVEGPLSQASAPYWPAADAGADGKIAAPWDEPPAPETPSFQSGFGAASETGTEAEEPPLPLPAPTEAGSAITAPFAEPAPAARIGTLAHEGGEGRDAPADASPELPFGSEPRASEPWEVQGASWPASAARDEVVTIEPEPPDDPNGFADPDGTPERLEPQGLADADSETETIETLGGDELEEVETQRSRVARHYKIQEVIKRRQIMLVQVTKEERGNKGAALTTYLSLAGRYCVLMPNTARGGGVSRKITNLGDRRRLKDILEDLDIPEGMGVIVRTAGAERSKAEIKRDYEYLLRLWNEIRELTLRSTAPALIYEEGDLIKRSIRDLYTRDIDEVLVEGEDGYRTAKVFMKMLMPSHAKRVQPYRDPQIGLLHRFQVESQIDAIHSPIVQLHSGGYLVIDQTEALVAIDVNSGRSTRERNIEETALRTNLEAAEEIARQLRLRDLAGLIVIDFIDMEEHRNQGAVERRLKDALKSDRARIQVGRISPFGLLEMSRQRLHPSLVEASTQPCPHCGGTGSIRSTESTALYVLRSIEEEGMRRRSAEVCVYVPTTVALYILNHKRESLAQLETRYGIHVLMAQDDALIPPAFRLERVRALEPGEAAAAVPAPLTQTPDIGLDEIEEDAEETAETEEAAQGADAGEEDRARLRRRRRRRRRHEDEGGRPPAAADDEPPPEAVAERVASGRESDGGPGDEEDDGGRLRRRRGRRGGRRRIRREESPAPGLQLAGPAADTIEIVAADPDGLPAAEDAPDLAMPAAPAITAPPLDDWATAGLTAEAIETASLPALAGESTAPPEAVAAEAAAAPPPHEMPAELPPEAAPAPEAWGLPAPAPEAPLPVESAARYVAPTIIEPAIVEPTIIEPATVEPTIIERANVEPANVEPATVEPPAQMPLAAAPNGPEPPAEPASDADTAGSIPEPAGQIVQDVTRKPENPRRGWWQRLIQP